MRKRRNIKRGFGFDILGIAIWEQHISTWITRVCFDSIDGYLLMFDGLCARFHSSTLPSRDGRERIVKRVVGGSGERKGDCVYMEIFTTKHSKDDVG